MRPEPDCDVLIAGGGPAGSALALALADGRRRVTVVEARAAPPRGDARAIALAEGSVRLLSALGVWPQLADGAVPIRTVEVSQLGRYGRARLRAGELGVAALGQVVSQDALARVLAGAASAARGVEWCAPARVASATTATEGARIGIAGESGHFERVARLAVAADGTASPLREALGLGTDSHDYRQTAVLATLDCGGDPHTGYERFTPEGPMALLPGGGTRRTLIWTLPPERAEAVAGLDDTELIDAIGARLGRSMGRPRLRSRPALWPLRRVEAERGSGERFALVGNAARTLHPVGAQGFNLALRDVCALAACLADTADPGTAEALQAWEAGRRTDQRLTRATTDLLARGFVRGGRALAPLRAGALLGLDLCPAARRAFAAQAMGLAGGLPRVGRWRLAPSA